MKRILIVSCSLAVIFAAFIFILAAIRFHQERAIISVFTQARNAYVEACHVRTNMHNDHSITNFSIKEFTTNLEKISTAECPKKFRLAWLNYVQTLERNNTPFSGLGAVTEFEVSTLGRSSGGTKDALARLDRLNGNEAFMKVETVALDYGVQLIRQ